MTRSWSGKSHGGGLGHALVHAFARYGGLRACYALLVPPATWFFVADATARRNAVRYWRRVRPSLGRWGAHVMAWRHFYSFARNLADRFLASAAPGSLRFHNRGGSRMSSCDRRRHVGRSCSHSNRRREHCRQGRRHPLRCAWLSFDAHLQHGCW